VLREVLCRDSQRQRQDRRGGFGRPSLTQPPVLEEVLQKEIYFERDDGTTTTSPLLRRAPANIVHVY